MYQEPKERHTFIAMQIDSLFFFRELYVCPWYVGHIDIIAENWFGPLNLYAVVIQFRWVTLWFWTMFDGWWLTSCGKKVHFGTTFSMSNFTLYYSPKTVMATLQDVVNFDNGCLAVNLKFLVPMFRSKSKVFAQMGSAWTSRSQFTSVFGLAIRMRTVVLFGGNSVIIFGGQNSFGCGYPVKNTS